MLVKAQSIVAELIDEFRDGYALGATLFTLIAEDANSPSTRKNSRETGMISSGL